MPHSLDTTVILSCVAFSSMIALSCGVPNDDPATASGVDADSLSGVLLAEIDVYYRDLSARDWEAFASHFWGGARLTTIWQPAGEPAERVWFISVPEFVAAAPDGPGSKPIFEEVRTGGSVTVQGRLAQVWAPYRARFGDEGEVMEWSGIDAFTLIEFEGVWKIVALAYVASE